MATPSYLTLNPSLSTVQFFPVPRYANQIISTVAFYNHVKNKRYPTTIFRDNCANLETLDIQRPTHRQTEQREGFTMDLSTKVGVQNLFLQLNFLFLIFCITKKYQKLSVIAILFQNPIVFIRVSLVKSNPPKFS